MTAQGSRIDLNRLGTYFRYKLGTLKGYAIVQLILGILSYPLTLAVSVTQMKAQAAASAALKAYDALGIEDFTCPEYLLWRELEGKSSFWNQILMCAMVLCAAAVLGIALMHFLTAIASYRWLYKKELVDMDYSLPISGDARFLGDFFAGLCAAGIPHLIIAIPSTIFIAAYNWGEGAESLRFFAQLPLTGVVACVMFYCFNLMLMSLFGRHGQMVVIPVVVNLLLTAGEIFGTILCRLTAFGINGDIAASNSVCGAAPYSPLGLVIGACYDAGFQSEYSLDVVPFILQPKVLIPVPVITAASFLAAWYVIRNRRSEDVGKPYVVPIARHIIHGLVTVAIVICFGALIAHYLGAGKEDSVTLVIIWTLAATFVAYFSLELTTVGLKKIWFTCLRYIGFTALGAGLALGLANCNGFGMGERAPVGARGVNIDLYNTQYHVSDWVSLSGDNVRIVTEIQNELPKRRLYSSVYEGLTERYIGSNANYRDSGYISAEFTYRLNNGMTCSYLYPITEEEYLDLMRKTTCVESLKNKYYSWLTDQYEEWEYSNINGYAANGVDVYSEENVKPCDIAFEDLWAAVEKDLANVNYDMLHTCVSGEYSTDVLFGFTITNPHNPPYESFRRLQIFPWFENTIAFLQEQGVEVELSPAANAKTAFLMKMDGFDVDSIDPLERNENMLYREEPTANMGIEEIFGLAGDESYFDYLVNCVYPYEDDPTELAEEAIERLLDDSCRSAKFVPMGSAELAELIEMGGSIYDSKQDYSKDYYALVLTNVSGEDLASVEYADYCVSGVVLHFPADKLSRAAEIYAGLSD